MADLKFAVKARSENSTKTVAEARGFKMIIDEPKDLGGTNDGANPVEYILAALSGCINVVGHLVAKEMNIPLNRLEIEIEGYLNPGKFSGRSDEERAGYKSIRVTLKPDTNADNDTLDKWIKVVRSRCPVSDNLANPTPVDIMLG